MINFLTNGLALTALQRGPIVSDPVDPDRVFGPLRSLPSFF